MEKIKLVDFNVVESEIIAVAVSVVTYCNKDTEVPETMVIGIATDPDKIPTHELDIPVYLPASGNYKSSAHYEMLDLFKNGDPFVAVRFENLQLYISKAGNYYGSAQGFSVEKHPKRYLEEEDLL